jgi:alginate O-acetyltransferase complex protein AlgJ|tara:strand:- start:750 stop:1886 length:1137 start_codon:yes stop_codon:yes gene_type:complete
MKGEEIQSERSKWPSITYAIVFVLLLAIPLLFLPFSGELDRSSEKRAPVAFPSFSSDYGNLPRAFEEWFEDHLGFRSAMIRFYRQSRFELGLLGSEKNILRGKEDWLYYAGNGPGNSIQAYTGANAFSESELNRLQLYFETWGNWLDDQGIEFLVLIAPNKVSVYPEYLPNRISRSPFGTRVERFLESMSGSGFPVVFPLGELLDKKSEGSLLYYKLDTHWNAKGAFVAYDVLIRKLSGSIRLSFADIEFDGSVRSGGDITELFGIKSDWSDMVYTMLLNRGNWATDLGASDFAGSRMHRFSVDDPTLPRALVFHDSFMDPMKGVLARHFSESVFSPDIALKRDLILEVKPDFVIVEFAERFLYSYLKHPLAGDAYSQ